MIPLVRELLKEPGYLPGIKMLLEEAGCPLSLRLGTREVTWPEGHRPCRGLHSYSHSGPSAGLPSESPAPTGA